MQIKTDINTLEVKNFIKKLTRKQKSVIDKGLKRVSNMAILMLTKRTQPKKVETPKDQTIIEEKPKKTTKKAE